ncbi:3',5'-cyclic-AMP phosphodiesterase, partial [Serratia marcescens]|nr:3',5'-cyclic-AMP phosphodiesterase [Serratia marcescens]
ILLRYPKVNTVVCGPIHQVLDLEWQGRRLLATPSTCVQYKPHCTNFTIDDVSPGWRDLDLLPDGRVETQVLRLENDDFRPDMDSDGY